MDIRVNGQSYSSWEQVPADLRAELAARLPDADGNGVPDLFETGALPPGAVTATSLSVDGQTYGSVAELPAPVQELLRQAFGMAPPAAPTEPTTPPPRAGQVVLNGETVAVGESATLAKKGFFRRLFGG